MAKKSKTFPVGRDSKTGRFVPVEKARQRPGTTVVERIPKPGYGDTLVIKKTARKYKDSMQRLAKR